MMAVVTMNTDSRPASRGSKGELGRCLGTLRSASHRDGQA